MRTEYDAHRALKAEAQRADRFHRAITTPISERPKFSLGGWFFVACWTVPIIAFWL